jgi:hypothetical protein
MRRKVVDRNIEDPNEALDIALHEADVNALYMFYGINHERQVPRHSQVSFKEQNENIS